MSHVPPERSPSSPRAVSLTVSVKLAWWLLLYLDGVLLMQAITGLDPDMEKVERMISRGIRVRPV
jgi:hypothetical protein